MDTLTTNEAAKLAGLTPAGFRRAMSRERDTGHDCRAPADQWPDHRTPLWDAEQLAAWLASRPGRGYWRRHDTPNTDQQRREP